MSNIPDLLEYSGRSWKECKEILEKEVTPQKVSANSLEYKPICLLPRKDFSLYGEFPKLDTKVLLECEKCGAILLPCIYHAHCNNPGHDKITAANTISTTNTTSAVSKQTSSKTNKPINYIPPGTSLLKKKYQQPKNKKKSVLPPPMPPPPALFTKTSSPPQIAATHSDGLAKPQASASASAAATTTAATSKPLSPQQPPSSSIPPAPPHPSNSKCKKSKKSAKKVKDDTEKVEKTEKTTETAVSPKTLNTVLTRKVCPKPKELHPLLLLLDDPSDTLDLNSATTIKETTTTSNNRCVPSYVNITQSPLQTTTAQKVDILQPVQVAIAPTTSMNKPQGNVEGSSSGIVYMPMSPVAVINNVPIQFLRLPTFLSRPLATQPIVVTIPLQNTNTPMYTSHPMPLSMATRTIRKIGSAYLLQNQRIDHQRNEIQTIAAASRRAVTNSCSALNTFHHRPNILKNSAKNNVKVAVKRTPSDKIMAENNKHIRLNDVNGFILHSDVSESAEAPLHNNSVHDKVTFLNMKGYKELLNHSSEDTRRR